MDSGREEIRKETGSEIENGSILIKDSRIYNSRVVFMEPTLLQQYHEKCPGSPLPYPGSHLLEIFQDFLLSPDREHTRHPP